MLTSIPYDKKTKKRFAKSNKKLKKQETLNPLKNPTEEQFRKLMKIRKLRITKSGYPDFMVFDNYRNIVAFVEVKANSKQKLKPTQRLFQKFCEQRRIPHFVWTPETDIPIYG